MEYVNEKESALTSCKLPTNSPRRLADPVFALDSLELRPSLGTLGDERKATVDFEESAPGLLVGHSTFSPGGSDGWENYPCCWAHQ